MMQKKIDGINIVPFIDIMLVLLVVVLMTATFVSQGAIPINLPHASILAKEEKALKEQEVAIKSDGSFYLNDKLTTLKELRSFASNIDKETPIAIRADASAHLEHLVTLLELFHNEEMNSISLLTQKP